MKCTTVSSILFCVIALIYGCAFAAVEQGLAYFNAGLFQFLRMLCAGLVCSLVLVIRLATQKGYLSVVKMHFKSGIWPIIHLCIAGILNLGLPHSIIAVSQEWVPSATVQLLMPLSTVSGALFSPCVLNDEPLNLQKGLSIGAACIGAVFSAVAPFRHPKGGGTAGNMAIGFIMCIISVSMFGIAAVYLKWKTPNADITVSSLVQMFASAIFCICWALIADGPSGIRAQLVNAPAKAFMWPVIVGTVAGAVAMHIFIYLLGVIGAEGGNLITILQLIIGVVIGVTLLDEWKPYSWWEILLNIIGMLFLFASIGIGFYHTTKSTEEEKEVEAASDDSHEIMEI